MRRRRMRIHAGDLAFRSVNGLIMLLLGITTVYPFVYLLSLSISSPELSFTSLHLIPPKFSFLNYRKVLANQFIALGFKNTIIRTALGTLVNVVLSVLAAYPLSKKYFPLRKLWTALIVFTMFFEGGLIPSYLLVKSLGLFDTVWALILPSAIGTFVMIIVRNFFMTLPESLEESARIDGASEITVLLRIVLPMSKPIIATASLWYAVGHWNAWFDSLIYMNDFKKQVLQVILRRIVLEGTQQAMDVMTTLYDRVPENPDAIKAATIMVATIPIILVYPFIQKYFVKGMIIGALKG
jgi:putative aldouronate transport system permease protein